MGEQCVRPPPHGDRVKASPPHGYYAGLIRLVNVLIRLKTPFERPIRMDMFCSTCMLEVSSFGLEYISCSVRGACKHIDRYADNAVSYYSSYVWSVH